MLDLELSSPPLAVPLRQPLDALRPPILMADLEAVTLVERQEQPAPIHLVWPDHTMIHFSSSGSAPRAWARTSWNLFLKNTLTSLLNSENRDHFKFNFTRAYTLREEISDELSDICDELSTITTPSSLTTMNHALNGHPVQ